MKRFVKYISGYALPVLMAGILLLPACEDNPGEAPQLPPASSMVIDFSGFDQNAKDDLSAWNYLDAAVTVTVWNVFITVGLAVPVAAFWESFNHEGIYQGDGEWIWSYNVTAGAIYKADLHGKVVNDSVRWEMYITRTDSFDDFLWYYGMASLDRSGGYWIMNEKPEQPNTLLRIDWSIEQGEETAGIKYTNIQPGGNENGGYIQYGRAENGDYDTYYDVYIKSSDKLVNILFNTETKEGRIKDPVYFKDGDWHCWDGSLQDVDCL